MGVDSHPQSKLTICRKMKEEECKGRGGGGCCCGVKNSPTAEAWGYAGVLRHNLLKMDRRGAVTRFSVPADLIRNGQKWQFKIGRWIAGKHTCSKRGSPRTKRTTVSDNLSGSWSIWGASPSSRGCWAVFSCHPWFYAASSRLNTFSTFMLSCRCGRRTHYQQQLRCAQPTTILWTAVNALIPTSVSVCRAFGFFCRLVLHNCRRTTTNQTLGHVLAGPCSTIEIVSHGTTPRQTTSTRFCFVVPDR